MKTPAYSILEKLTAKAPVIEALTARREELRRLLVAQRNPVELTRLQGAAEETDRLLAVLQNPADVPRPAPAHKEKS